MGFSGFLKKVLFYSFAICLLLIGLSIMGINVFPPSAFTSVAFPIVAAYIAISVAMVKY